MPSKPRFFAREGWRLGTLWEFFGPSAPDRDIWSIKPHGLGSYQFPTSWTCRWPLCSGFFQAWGSSSKEGQWVQCLLRTKDRHHINVSAQWEQKGGILGESSAGIREVLYSLLSGCQTLWIVLQDYSPEAMLLNLGTGRWFQSYSQRSRLLLFLWFIYQLIHLLIF